MKTPMSASEASKSTNTYIYVKFYEFAYRSLKLLAVSIKICIKPKHVFKNGMSLEINL